MTTRLLLYHLATRPANAIRAWLWRLALRHLSPHRPRDKTLHVALIEECLRLQTRPDTPPIFKSACGVPYELEQRLRAELEAANP